MGSKRKLGVGVDKVRWAVVVVTIQSLEGAQKLETTPLARSRQARSRIIDRVDAVRSGVSGFYVSRVVDSGCHHVARR